MLCVTPVQLEQQHQEPGTQSVLGKRTFEQSFESEDFEDSFCVDNRELVEL